MTYGQASFPPWPAPAKSARNIAHVEKVDAVYKKIITGMKPEKTASRFYKEVLDELQKGGLESIPDYGLGQGIGLGLHESPYMNNSDQTSMKQGMCFAIRLTAKDGEIGAIMTGDTILLTEAGPEKLTA